MSWECVLTLVALPRKHYLSEAGANRERKGGRERERERVEAEN